jgi:molybdopterin converting factor small subunit
MGDLRSSADEHDFLERVDERQISILLNGKLTRRAEGLQTVLEEQDAVTFMVLATGG